MKVFGWILVYVGVLCCVDATEQSKAKVQKLVQNPMLSSMNAAMPLFGMNAMNNMPTNFLMSSPYQGMQQMGGMMGGGMGGMMGGMGGGMGMMGGRMQMPNSLNSMMYGNAAGFSPNMMGQYGMMGGGGMMGQNGMMGGNYNTYVPGRGYQTADGTFSVYPSHGSKPITAHNPYSQFNYGGYDAYGFPNPHPGVASSTPMPPKGGEAAKKA